MNTEELDALKELQKLMPTRQECGWCKLHHPKGPQVTIPVTATPLDYASLLANVSAMLDAGWLVQAPGLDEGEHKDDIGWVVKTFVGEDGTPAIDLYPANEATKYAMMRVYLNKPDDIAAFEYASKLKLDSLPDYIGTGKLERGKSPQTDKLITQAPRPFGVVWKDNPKYNPDETDATKKKPKRLFVRWADQKPVPKPEPPPPSPHETNGDGDTMSAEASDKILRHCKERNLLDYLPTLIRKDFLAFKQFPDNTPVTTMLREIRRSDLVPLRKALDAAEKLQAETIKYVTEGIARGENKTDLAEYIAASRVLSNKQKADLTAAVNG